MTLHPYGYRTVDDLLGLAGADTRVDLRPRFPHPSASCDMCGARQGTVYGSDDGPRRFGWFPAPDVDALGMYGTLCSGCIATNEWPEIQSRADFEAKWQGRHPTSWNTPEADEWCQDVWTVEGIERESV